MSEHPHTEELAEMGGAQPEGLPVRLGDEFPDLVLPSVETGDPLSLASFRGAPLILHFFASW